MGLTTKWPHTFDLGCNMAGNSASALSFWSMDSPQKVGMLSRVDCKCCGLSGATVSSLECKWGQIPVVRLSRRGVPGVVYRRSFVMMTGELGCGLERLGYPAMEKVSRKTVGRGMGSVRANAVQSFVTLTGLRDFIIQGPLLEKVGETSDSVFDKIHEWARLGAQLSLFLGFSAKALSEAENVRIYQYYLPVFFWCQRQLALHRSGCWEKDSIPPLVIGISAPQGCGKTTIVESLDYLLNSNGSPAAAVSIDDFYLKATDQEKLAKDNPGNSLLELRGNAGSHDLVLGTDSLKALFTLTRNGTETKLPRYNKSARDGKGDRAELSSWPVVKGPLEVVLFEGWMLGFEPLENSVVKAVDPQLEIVNQNLAAYYNAWHCLIDSWIVIKVGDPNWVFKWRLEAEVAMRAKGKGAMSDDEVADFVSRYIPAYKAYLPALYGKGPRGAKSEHVLQFNINQGRTPIG